MTLGHRLIEAAKEARAIARGEVDPATYRVHVPEEIDVAAIRRGLALTQTAFAAAYGFSPGAVRDWEQGRRRPDAAVRAYLLVIRHNPQAVRAALVPA